MASTNWASCSRRTTRSRRTNARTAEGPLMKARIAVIAGDGIGPEVVAEGVRVLERVAAKFHHEFTLNAAPFGGAAIDRHDDPLPKATLDECLAADAVLLGAIGGPK